MKYAIEFGENVKARMKERGETWASLSQKAGVSQGLIRNAFISNGERVKVHHLLAILNALEMNPGDVFVVVPS